MANSSSQGNGYIKGTVVTGSQERKNWCIMLCQQLKLYQGNTASPVNRCLAHRNNSMPR